MNTLKHRLILIEGIPGSGKTTLARKLNSLLKNEGIDVEMFEEGQLHPVDLAWCSYLTIEEFEQLLEQYPSQKAKLLASAQQEGAHVVIAYTKLGFYPDENPLMTYLTSKEVYQGKVSKDDFEAIHLRRWQSFTDCINPETCYIFECVYFQNHIVELLGEHQLSDEDLRDYLIKLISTVRQLNPLVIYLDQKNPEETIRRVAQERRTTDSSKWQDWIDLVIAYVEQMPYAKARKLKGYQGALAFFEDRKRIELAVLKDLPVEILHIDNSDYDLEQVMVQISDYLHLGLEKKESFL